MAPSLVHSVCLIFLFVSITKVKSDHKIFNVMKHVAVNDGEAEISQALLYAWSEACQYSGRGFVMIPKGTYLLNPVEFSGPCNGQTLFWIEGDLKAPDDRNSWANTDRWITFQNVNNLEITGGGSLDGQGPYGWPYNNCRDNPNCEQLPISLRLDVITNSWIHDIKLINSKNFHMNVHDCHDTRIEDIQITAPIDSPNTDGIHIGSSSNLLIKNSFISTGDDCISMGPGTQNVVIDNVTCGPGHGISIGSLGKYPNEEDIKGLIIRNCKLTGTSNGARIKTWATSHASKVYNVTYENIRMEDAYNPILIDQQYCPNQGGCSHQGDSQVQISDVKFRNIWGISKTKAAVDLNCSPSKPCYDLELKDINLYYTGPDGLANSVCNYANGSASGRQQPRACI